MVNVHHLIGPASFPAALSSLSSSPSASDGVGSSPGGRTAAASTTISVLSWNVLLPNSIDGWWTYKMYLPPLVGDRKDVATWEHRRKLLRDRISQVGELRVRGYGCIPAFQRLTDQRCRPKTPTSFASRRSRPCRSRTISGSCGTSWGTAAARCSGGAGSARRRSGNLRGSSSSRRPSIRTGRCSRRFGPLALLVIRLKTLQPPLPTATGPGTS